jgi:hypothetical protein
MRLPLRRPDIDMLLHWRIAAIVFWLFVLPGFSQDLGKELSLPDYIAELDRLAAAVDNYHKNPAIIQELKQRMPHRWTVQAGNRIYHVNCEWLTAGLAELLEIKSDESSRSIRDQIARLKADAQAMLKPSLDPSSNRKALGEILARREFQSVRSPTWWDRWMQNIAAFVGRMLSKLFRNTRFPVISDKVIYALLIIAALVLAVWIFRTVWRYTKLETIALQNAVPVSAKPWTAWMADAHAAAAKQCWRDAVHLSYWAGISFLESRGFWQPDAARTPREYLRLLPSSSGHRDSLSALTRKSEAIWYGNMEAGPESFFESLRHLESLGCQSN